MPKKIVKTINQYLCDVCNFPFHSYTLAVSCELRHKNRKSVSEPLITGDKFYEFTTTGEQLNLPFSEAK